MGNITGTELIHQINALQSTEPLIFREFVINASEGEITEIRNQRLESLMMVQCNIHRVNLIDCDLTWASFASSTLIECAFINCNLRKAEFHQANCNSVDFSGCQLFKASFLGASMQSANLTNCDLSGALMIDVDLRHTILEHVNLAYAIFANAKLYNTRKYSLLNVNKIQTAEGLDMSPEGDGSLTMGTEAFKWLQAEG